MNEAIYPPNIEAGISEDLEISMGQWRAELEELLPTLRQDVTTEFVYDLNIAGMPDSTEDTYLMGVGGSTVTANRIKLAIDPSKINTPGYNELIKATFFHEHFHIARGYNHQDSVGLSLLDTAIEEGSATKFEMITVGSMPGWGKYQDRETMLERVNELKNSVVDEHTDWSKWKFYDPETDRHWILYRVGAFIVDEALANGGLEIQDLAVMTREEILEKANLA
ncbi:MAG: DUF2268 domain-containing putative Zn-dependent protease [Candidatus Saccharibacteria bacterium]